MGEIRLEILRFGHVMAEVGSPTELKQWIVNNVPCDTLEGSVAPSTPYDTCVKIAEGKGYSFRIVGEEEVDSEKVARLSKILSCAKFPEVAADILYLSRIGRYNYKAQCPCCNGEDTLVIIPKYQIYKCFGCGRTGNVINFVMETKNLSFESALDYLENKYVKE